jgi:hypothetical protein
VHTPSVDGIDPCPAVNGVLEFARQDRARHAGSLARREQGFDRDGRNQ